jgi:hypothetical protein
MILAHAAILGTWLLLFVLFAGSGLLARRLFGARGLEAGELPVTFWVGWAGTLALLQLWHLFARVDGAALLVLVLPGLAGLVAGRDELRSALATLKRRHAVAMLLALPALFLLANRAIGPPLNPDSGYYHVPSIRWILEHPLVIGLGNLDSLLVYNSSHYLHAAALWSTPWSRGAHHVANGLLLVPVILQIAHSMAELAAGAARLRHLYWALLCGPVLSMVLGPNVSSFSPDLPVALLQWVLCGHVLGLFEHPRSARDEGWSLVTAAVLAALGVTVKLSFAALGLGLCAVAACVWLWRPRSSEAAIERRALAWVGAVAGLVLGVWMLRGILLSGYPAYPSPVPSAPVSWRVPEALIEADLLQIRAWSRAPWLGRDVTLGSWGWLDPWSRTVVRFYHFDLIVPLLLGLTGCALGFVYRRPRGAEPRGGFTVPAACAAALAVWFTQAPDPRFALGPAWSFAAASWALALSGYVQSAGERPLAAAGWPLVLVALGPAVFPRAASAVLWAVMGVPALCAVLVLWRRSVRATFVAALAALWMSALLTAAAAGPYRKLPLLLGPGPASGLHPMPSPRKLGTFRTDWGVELSVPGRGIVCWDAAPPCTKRPSAGVRMRREGDLSAGFVREPRP